MLSKAIKGAAKVAKPHLIATRKDLLAAGTKRGIEEVNKKLVHKPQNGGEEQNGKVYK